jgi:membrane associated rhomboid family serine protease
MFPVSDVIPSRSTPYVTIGLIAACVLAYLYQWQLSRRELLLVTQLHGVVPAFFSWGSVLTGMFLHAGPVHLGGNMLYLWIFGDTVEDRLGHVQYLGFYVLCGAAAAVGQVTANPHSTVPMLGASGAIAGVMGAYFVLYPRSRVLTAVFVVLSFDLIEIPAIYYLGIWFLMQLFSGVGALGAPAADGSVAFWAHVAGFATGAAGGAYWRTQKFHHREPSAGRLTLC